jgi:retron-type reverse transcriptase
LSLARDNYGDGGDGQSVGWSFGSIDQTKLLKLVALRISDRRVLKLLRLWLAAGVMEGEQWVATLSGTPQGGVISPLLSNIYLHVLDRVWEDRCAPWDAVNPQGEEPMPEAKPYAIPKQLVWDAYQRVKANRGAAGVDGESLAAFETDLKNNLYKVWNRMASGSYFPPPVRLVEIEKESGGTRPLGIPTVADRVAQTVVKMVLEPIVDPHFHSDSYGYRPGKSALDAVGVARKRCWDADWVVDLDIKGFFDSIPHDLVERAVAHHTDSPWVRLYIARWLRAPMQRSDGTREERTRARRKVESSVRCWLISFCITRLTCGCSGRFRASTSSAMRTMPSSIAEVSDTPARCWKPSEVVSRSVVCSFIRRRRGSSTARATTDRGITSMSRSISLATPSSLVGPRTAGGSTS